MGKLLKFEWRKLWQQKSLYVVFIIGLISIVVFSILSKVTANLVNALPGVSENVLNATKFTLLALNYSSLPSLLGIFVALFACSDHSQHTIKNIYARGYSRSAVYFSKYFVSLIVSILMSLVYVVFCFLFVIILGGSVTSMAAYLWGYLALQFLVVFGFHGLFFGISMMFGKLSGSLIVNLVGVDIIFALLNSLISIAKIDFDILQYNLETILLNLATNTGVLSQGDLIRAIVVPICYAIIFVFGGWLVNRRRDV